MLPPHVLAGFRETSPQRGQVLLFSVGFTVYGLESRLRFGVTQFWGFGFSMLEFRL